MRPSRGVRFVLVLLVLCGLAGVRRAGATPPLERKARSLGLAVSDCTYCHAFSMDHMTKKALQMGIPPMNCYACHGGQLPRRGSALFNDRGRWLLSEKRRRVMKEVDVAWLKDYVPPAAAVPAARK